MITGNVKILSDADPITGRLLLVVDQHRNVRGVLWPSDNRVVTTVSLCQLVHSQDHAVGTLRVITRQCHTDGGIPVIPSRVEPCEMDDGQPWEP